MVQKITREIDWTSYPGTAAIGGEIIMGIEDTICEAHLPVNTIAMLERLKELLKEHETNTLLACRAEEACHKDVRIQKLLWLINQQWYGEFGKIDLSEEWSKLCKEEKSLLRVMREKDEKTVKELEQKAERGERIRII